MDVVAEDRVGVHRVHDRLDEIARMAGGVTHAADAWDFSHAAEQRGKVHPAGEGRDSC